MGRLCSGSDGLRSRAAVQAAKSAPQVAKVAAKVAPVGAAVKASPQAAKALKAANDGKLAVSERYNATAAQLAQRFADADTPEQFEDMLDCIVLTMNRAIPEDVYPRSSAHSLEYLARPGRQACLL